MEQVLKDGEPTGLLNNDGSMMEVSCYVADGKRLLKMGTRWVAVTAEQRRQIIEGNTKVVSTGYKVEAEQQQRLYSDELSDASMLAPLKEERGDQTVAAIAALEKPRTTIHLGAINVSNSGAIYPHQIFADGSTLRSTHSLPNAITEDTLLEGGFLFRPKIQLDDPGVVHTLTGLKIDSYNITTEGIGLRGYVEAWDKVPVEPVEDELEVDDPEGLADAEAARAEGFVGDAEEPPQGFKLPTTKNVTVHISGMLDPRMDGTYYADPVELDLAAAKGLKQVDLADIIHTSTDSVYKQTREEKVYEEMERLEKRTKLAREDLTGTIKPPSLRDWCNAAGIDLDKQLAAFQKHSRKQSPDPLTKVLVDVADPDPVSERRDTEGEHSGHNVNYYSVPITRPKRPERAPYIFEVEDLIQALNLGFHEGTVLKSLVRSATERELGLVKRGGDAVRDAEKMVHSSQEILRDRTLRKGSK